MNDIKDVGNYFTSQAFLASAVIVCLTAVLLIVIKKYLIKKVAYTTKKDEQHQNTFIGVVFNLLQYAVILACVVLVLQLHGVNVTSIIAGLGIVATLIGLALQDTMKDIISGINIYNNNFYKVGDIVKYGDDICEVKYFSARVTKFCSMYTGSTFTVCNSNISSIEKIKNRNILMVTFDWDIDKEVIDECFENARAKALEKDFITQIDYFGLMDMTDRGMIYVAGITAGHQILAARGEMIQQLTAECKKHNIMPNFDDERKVKMVED